MTGIFKANNPLNPFFLFIYGLLLKLIWFINPFPPVIQKSDGFLFGGILSKLEPAGLQFPLIYPIITYSLIFIQAVTLNKHINNQRLMHRVNYLPAMSYLLITSMFSEWNVFSSLLVVNTLLIFVWASMSTLHSSSKPKTVLFNAGMLIGVSTFFYFPSLAFLLLIIYALLLSRPFILADWIISFLGILTPYYFLFSYLFLTDKLYNFKIPPFDISFPRFNQNYWELAGIVLVLISFIIGFYFLRTNIRKQPVQIRKSWNFILLYLIIALFVPFINATHTFEYWILAAVPLSAYAACAFLYPVKRWLPLVLHWLMIIAVFVISYGLK